MEDYMKPTSRFALMLLFIFILPPAADALPPVEGTVFGITPLVNEMSLYKNVDDLGHSRGYTLQIIAINSIRIGTSFTLEFTGDFNWNTAYELDGSIKHHDHYMELSIVKPVYKILSLNYQRIYSTFESHPINQFGFRLSL